VCTRNPHCKKENARRRWRALNPQPTKRCSPEWRAKISAANKGWRNSPASEFKKGNVPWSKGRHVGSRPGSVATQFQRGQIRGQAARKYRHVGFISIRTDKSPNKRIGRNRFVRRRWIKVRNYGPPSRRWVPLARRVWERKHGPVPPGYFVVHRDGDTLNDAPSNLMLMDRQHLLRWQHSVRPRMEARRRRGNAIAQRQRWAEYYAVKNRTRAAD